MMEYNIETLTHALGVAARAFLAALDDESVAQRHQIVEKRGSMDYGESVEFDPLEDDPPYSVNPVGSRQEQKMTSLAYLGAIARVNAATKRGANTAEVSEFAKKAGYPDGRAVSGWNSRSNSSRVIENVSGARILNENGHHYLHELAADLNIMIVGDVTPLPIPEVAQSGISR
jgi:hypothetical protein